MLGTYIAFQGCVVPIPTVAAADFNWKASGYGAVPQAEGWLAIGQFTTKTQLPPPVPIACPQSQQ